MGGGYAWATRGTRIKSRHRHASSPPFCFTLLIVFASILEPPLQLPALTAPPRAGLSHGAMGGGVVAMGCRIR
jgi:hypothetical protein